MKRFRNERKFTMFSMFKKSSTEQEVVLPSLNEEQLAQVAGGYDCSDKKATSSSDNHNWQWNMTHKHHKHHKHHKMHTWNTSSSHGQHMWNSTHQQKW
jgi:hypothetical protein